MPMSKKHYEAIAQALNNVMWDDRSDPATMANVIVAMSTVCENDNPRFDRQRFLMAATANPSTK